MGAMLLSTHVRGDGVSEPIGAAARGWFYRGRPITIYARIRHGYVDPQVRPHLWAEAGSDDAGWTAIADEAELPDDDVVAATLELADGDDLRLAWSMEEPPNSGHWHLVATAGN